MNWKERTALTRIMFVHHCMCPGALVHGMRMWKSWPWCVVVVVWFACLAFFLFFSSFVRFSFLEEFVTEWATNGRLTLHCTSATITVQWHCNGTVVFIYLLFAFFFSQFMDFEFFFSVVVGWAGVCGVGIGGSGGWWTMDIFNRVWNIFAIFTCVFCRMVDMQIESSLEYFHWLF